MLGIIVALVLSIIMVLFICCSLVISSECSRLEEMEGDFYMKSNVIGKFIRNEREKLRLSKKDLSKLSNISEMELIRIESGEKIFPSSRTLRKISRHLNVNYNDLMYKSGLGSKVSPLNPFILNYYTDIKKEDVDITILELDNLLKKNDNIILELNNIIDDSNREMVEDTIADLEYESNTNKKIIKLLNSQKIKYELEERN